MGYYIETSKLDNKAHDIIAKHGGVLVDQGTARAMVADPETAVIVVVDNGFFEAAGFAYDEQEFRAFTHPSDQRPKQFLLLKQSTAIALTGYSEEA